MQELYVRIIMLILIVIILIVFMLVFYLNKEEKKKWKVNRGVSEMKKVMQILEKIFYILFGSFVIIIIKLALERLPYMQGSEQRVYMQGIIVVLAFVLIVMYCLDRKDNERRKRDLFFLFLGSFFIRCLIVLFIGIDANQVSDYNSAYVTAISDWSTFGELANKKEFLFPSWAMYPIYLRNLMNLFGEGVLTCIIGNAVVTSVSGCLIYLLCRNCNMTRRVAILSAILFICWPSYLLYTIVLSPEHINIMLVLLSLNLFTVSLKKERKKQQYVYLVLSAISLGISYFFKSVAPIAIIAYIIILILELPKKISGEDKRIKNIWKSILVKLFLFLIIYFLASNGGWLFIENTYNHSVNRGIANYYIAIGLNPESGGRLSKDIVEEYKETYEKNYNFDEANEVLKQRILKNIEGLKKENFVEFFTGKIQLGWQSDEYSAFVMKTVNTEGNSMVNTEQWHKHLMVIIHGFYMIICFLVLITTVMCLAKKNINRIILFSFLFIFGMACLLLITEVQPRYKCVTYPYWSIIAAYGIENISIDIKKMLSKVSNYMEK